jgi:hypothetical protein
MLTRRESIEAELRRRREEHMRGICAYLDRLIDQDPVLGCCRPSEYWLTHDIPPEEVPC